MHTIHKITFLLKKRTKGVNMSVKNIEAFMRRKKTKKSQYACGRYRKLSKSFEFL